MLQPTMIFVGLLVDLLVTLLVDLPIELHPIELQKTLLCLKYFECFYYGSLSCNKFNQQLRYRKMLDYVHSNVCALFCMFAESIRLLIVLLPMFHDLPLEYPLLV